METGAAPETETGTGTGKASMTGCSGAAGVTGSGGGGMPGILGATERHGPVHSIDRHPFASAESLRSRWAMLSCASRSCAFALPLAISDAMGNTTVQRKRPTKMSPTMPSMRLAAYQRKRAQVIVTAL